MTYLEGDKSGQNLTSRRLIQFESLAELSTSAKAIKISVEVSLTHQVEIQGHIMNIIEAMKEYFTKTSTDPRPIPIRHSEDSVA